MHASADPGLATSQIRRSMTHPERPTDRGGRREHPRVPMRHRMPRSMHLGRPTPVWTWLCVHPMHEWSPPGGRELPLVRLAQRSSPWAG